MPSAASTRPVIETIGLRKTYRYHRSRPGLRGSIRDLFSRQHGERVAVVNLDLRIEAGEFVGLLGRNGAGKTTTLKMLSGLLRPTTGTARVLDHEPHRRGFDFLSRIAIVLGSKSMLWWDVSTLDNLRLHQALYDLDHDHFDQAVDELGALLGVGDQLDIPVRKLSLGERMKCELILALLHRPQVLFLDEPTIGLDVVSKAAIRDFLRAINRERGTTIILTSHDMDDVEELCRRVVLIDDGMIRFDGSPDDLVRITNPRKRMIGTFASGERLELEVERSQVSAMLASWAGRGELVDLEVRDADLDDVMRQVLQERRS